MVHCEPDINTYHHQKDALELKDLHDQQLVGDAHVGNVKVVLRHEACWRDDHWQCEEEADYICDGQTNTWAEVDHVGCFNVKKLRFRLEKGTLSHLVLAWSA